MQTLTPAQFAELWGSGEVKPQLALDRSADNAVANFSTRVRETKLTARCGLALDVEETSLRVRLAAHVTAQGGPAFQYRLNIPAALHVDELSAFDSQGPRPAHWARTGENSLTVLLAAPASGEIKLLVRGRLPRSGETAFSLPEISVQGSDQRKASGHCHSQ